MRSPFFILSKDLFVVATVFCLAVTGIRSIVLDNNFRSSLRLYPSENIKYFTLGYNNAISGSLWLTYLPNNGKCDQATDAPTSYNPGNSLKEILVTKLKPSRCHLSWVYHVLDLITELTPNFFKVYLSGAIVLSVVVDDREGAKRIFDKGLALFPDHWELNYRAGYHYLYELQDPETSIRLLEASYRNGGPKWLPALIAGLYNEMGKALLAKNVIEDFLKTNPTGHALERAQERLKEINAILAKQTSSN